MRRFGAHTIGYEPPALVHFVLRGTLAPEEMEALSVFVHERAAGQPFLLGLTALSEVGAVPAETRKVAMRYGARIPFRGQACYGGSFRAKLLLKLVIGALRLVTRNGDLPMQFFETEAEARAWLAERLRELNADQRAGPGHPSSVGW